jgi:nucleoside-triphosphatase THEP1
MSKILITGIPKSEKSTLTEKVLNNLDVKKRGFLTM